MTRFFYLFIYKMLQCYKLQLVTEYIWSLKQHRFIRKSCCKSTLKINNWIVNLFPLLFLLSLSCRGELTEEKTASKTFLITYQKL